MTKSTKLVRFWGWTENAAEEAADLKELSALAAAGKPLYGEFIFSKTRLFMYLNFLNLGESDMTPFVQGAAHRNSAFSQLKFGKWPVPFSIFSH